MSAFTIFGAVFGAVLAGQLPELARVIAADRKDARQKQAVKDAAERRQALERAPGGEPQ